VCQGKIWYSDGKGTTLGDWHEVTIVKCLNGLSENATKWEKRLDKKYGNLTHVIKRIDYDLRDKM
jgi:hypothetical protein